MKRWRARARGRVARIKKPTCHITVKLAPGPDTARIPPPAPEPEPAVEEETPTAVTDEATPEDTPEAEADASPEKKEEADS
jgi:hypothetical protein